MSPFIPQIRLYQDWLARERGLSFADYDALWRWSTTDLDAFWQSIWDYFRFESPTPHEAVLGRDGMPGAQWFPGAQVNYVRQVMRHVDAAHAAGLPAVVSDNERGQRRELSWPELRRQVASLALHLRAQGVQRGDRVAAYLPNVPEAMVAFLACASIGAIWSICAPDMGTAAVLDRFRQIEPVALIACDGVTYGGRDHDRRPVVAELRAALPTVRHTLMLQNLGGLPLPEDACPYAQAVARDDAATRSFEADWLPFDHPLWIVYSSGTTGLPKPIVHGHGGVMIVMHALGTLHNDVGCSYEANSRGERFFWYSSTGWIMWNCQLIGLLGGTTCCIYDGNPGGSKERPDWGVLWRFAADTGVTFFGAGAAFYGNCMKAGLELSTWPELKRVRALGTTGSPLPADVQQWGIDQFATIDALATMNAFATGDGPSSARSEGSPAPAGPGPGASAPSGGSELHAVGERGGPAAALGRPEALPTPSGGSELHAVGERGGPAAALGRPEALPTPSGGSELHAVGERGGPAAALGRPEALPTPSGGSELHAVSERGGPIWWCNISGGTDFAGAFLGGNRELPQVPGEMQCRMLGSAVESWNEHGQPVVGEVGELVCTRPIPSMPLYFWGDAGHQRYLSSYFDMYPGVWRHGDWLLIQPSGGCIIYGRSDATINRHGLRMGTSELYSAVEGLPEVLDSLVVDLEYLGRESWMPLFVVLREGRVLDDALRARLNAAIRTALSPRFVPDAIYQVPEIPRTLSGKKQELPIKKLLLGQPLEKVVNRDAMANPACLDWYVALARERLGVPA